MNLALHALAALLVWRVLFQLRVPGALFAAAIFALHPVNVETAAWIAQLKGILSLVLALVSVLFYLSNERRASGLRYGLALGTFLLSALAKGTAITLPAVLLACAWWQRGRIDRRDLLRVAPYLLIGAMMGGAEMWAQQHLAHQDVVRTDDFFSRLAVAGCALWFYLGKIILPIKLCPIYSQWSIDPRSPLSYLPGVMWLIVLGLAWWKRRTWGRPVVMLMVCYAALLLPILGFVNIYFMRFSLVSDHWQYIATIVPCAVFAGVTTSLARRLLTQPAAIAGAAALLVVLGVMSLLQSRVYEDGETFYEAVLAQNPDCWVVYNDLGALLQNGGRFDAAIADYHKAIDLNPDYAEANNNLGAALVAQGQYPSAIACLRRALEISPNYADAHIYLGLALAANGEIDSSISHFQRALEINPTSADAHCYLAMELLDRGQFDLAVAHFQRAIEIDPNDFKAHNNLANALLGHGQANAAAAHYRRALEINPELAEAHNNLGNLLFSRGQVDEAIGHYKKALVIKPDLAEVHYRLGIALLSRREADAAIAQFQRALEIRSNYADAHYNLGNALLGRGQAEAAIAHYQKALELTPNYVEAHDNLAAALASRGELDSAIVQFEKSLEIKPDNTVARRNLAVVRSERERIVKNIAQQRADLLLRPDDAALLEDVAWTLATNPNASIRNGAEAVELAEQASKRSGGNDPVMLQTLAAAYAEVGRFPDAVRADEQAEQLASTTSNRTLLEQIRTCLDLYKNQKPFRQAPAR